MRPRWRQVIRHIPEAVGLGCLLILAITGFDMARATSPAAHVFPWQGATNYQINVFSGGRTLTSDEVRARYRLPIRGTTALTPEGLHNIVRDRETRMRTSETFVRVHTRHNGAAEEVWLWPEK